MTTKFLLNWSGVSPDVMSRKGRYNLDPILSRLCLASLICLCMLTVGVGNAWGETVTYTFSSKSWAASPANWTSNTDGSGFESSGDARGVANNGVSGACTSPTTFSNVSSISVVASSNTTGGKVAIKIGGTQIADKSIGKSNNATYTYNSSDYSSIASLSGNVQIVVTKPSSKTVWVKSITITYTPAASCSTNPTVGSASNSSISVTGATVSCTGITKGDCDIDEWGFVYGTATEPTGNAQKVSSGKSTTNVPSFNKTLTGLDPNQKYYVRAYAKVGSSTFYGSETNFTTKTITASSSNTTYGTVSRSKMVITGSPKSGGQYASPAYTVTGSTPANATTVTQSGNTFTVTSTSTTNITVTINFEAIPTYTVTWVAGSNSSFNSQTGTAGTALTDPGTPSAASYCPGGKVFVGWTATPIDGEQNSAPADLFTSVSGKSIPSGGTTYYAVFATAAESSTKFKRMADLSELNSASKIAFINSYSSSRYILNTSLGAAATTPTESDGEITVSDGQYWTLESSNSNWKFKTGTDYLVASTIPTSSSKSGAVSKAASGNTEWVITSNSYTSNGTPVFTVYSAASSTAGLEYNSGWLVYYGTNFNTSWYTIRIYVPKKTYSAYATTCCTPLGSINGSVSLSQLASPDPTKLKATWTMNASTGIASYNLAVYNNSTGVRVDSIVGYTSGDEITGLNPCTTYYVKLYTVSSGGGYCDGGLISTSSTCTTNGWGVSESLTNTTHVTGASTACPASNYVATYTATTGNVLPSSVAVSIGGVSKTQGTHYTWSVSNGTGTLTILAANITTSTGAIAITVSSAAASCTGQYCINSYDTGGNGMTCFTGNSMNRTISDYVIPATNLDDRNVDLWVGYSGAWASHSENWHFRWIPLKELTGGCGMRLGVAPQAVGTLTINSGSSNNNYELTFDPNGYGFVYGSGDSWSNRAFVQQTDPNVWRTAVFALSTTEIGKNYYVGLAKSGGGYVKTLDYDYNDADEHIWGPSLQGTISGMGVANGVNGSSEVTFRDGGLNNGDDGMRGFYEIWSNNCNRNFYCHFVPVHRIVYHANWPVSGSPADTYSVDVSVEESSTIANPAAPSAPTGYHFLGWYDDPSGGNLIETEYTISAGATADVTLYAHWSNTTAITLSKNGGADNGRATATYGSNTLAAFTPVTRNSTTYRLLGYSKSGTPSEIVIDKDGHLVANTTYTDASGNWKSTAAEVTLVAQWKAGHTITWSANGTTYETSFVDSDGTIALPAGTPTSCDASDTHTYTTFIGWYTTAAGTNSAPTTDISDCGTKIVGGEACPANDITYHAVWGNGALVGGETKELTLDFTSNTTWQFPTDYVTSSSEASFTNTYTVKVAGDDANGYKWNSSTSSLIVGKENAYLKLPAFSFTTSKLVVTGPATGASGKVTWNVFVGSTTVSTEVTGANGEHTFNIGSSYQAAGNVYIFKVTNDNNTQFKTIDVYSAVPGATGFISSCCSSAAVVSVTPTSDNLELDIDGQATTSVSVSQSGGGAGRYHAPTIDPAVGATTNWAGEYKTSAYSVNFNATAAGTYTVKADFTETAAGCAKYGTATITVAANPLVQTSVDALTVNGVCDDSGTPQTFTLNSRYLPNASKTLTITAATTSVTGGAYKVSLDGSTYSTSVNVTGGTSAKATQTVYVRYEGAADEVNASLAGSVTISNGVTSASVTLSGACTCGTYVKLTPANATSTHILAPNGQWTRAQGAIAIRANYLSSAAANVNIKLTSSNNKFKFTTGTSAGSATFESGKVVTASNNSWDGTVYIVYTPTSYDASESTTITAEVITFGGTTVHASTTTTVYGRSFPETFVLAVNTGSSWVAVPADMIAPYGGSGNQCTTGVGTHDPYPITVDNNANPTTASVVPARAIYKGASRNTPTSAPWTVQMESNSQTGYYLWGSKTANTIANENFATGERQKWFAESNDLVTFNFHLDDSIRTAGARLGYNGTANNIGQYVSAASTYKYDFRILPISGEPCAYIINPVMTLEAYDGTTATVSIPYDGTTNYEISKDNKETWTDITGTIDCKKLTFSLPLATYRGTDIWLRADGTVCQGDATSVSSLHIPAPVITDPADQHFYGVINVATSESFAVTSSDLYGTIAVSSSNPAITANYSEGNITVNMASTAVADDYVTTLTLSSVGAARVTVDVTITIRDLAEMTFYIEDLHNGKICADDLSFDHKFYVTLNNNSAVYSANNGSTLVNAPGQYSSAVFIRDLSTHGDDWSTGFTYVVTSGIASFAIPTTNLVPGHTYRISYYNDLANSGNGLFNSSRLGFADAYQDIVFSSDCTAPTAMMPCLTSPTSAVANWVYDNCAGTATVSVYTKNETTLMDKDCRTSSGWNVWKTYSSNITDKWLYYNSTGTWVGPGSTYGPLLNKASYKAYIYSPQVGQMNGGVTITADTEIEVTVSVYCYNNQKSIQCYVIDGEPTSTSGTLVAGAKACYYNGANTKTDSYTTELALANGTTQTLNSFRIKGLTSTCRLAFTVGNYASSAGIYVQHVTVKTVTKGTPTNYTPTCSDGTQVMSGLTANTQYYYTVTNGGHTSGEVAFHTWASGSSYVKFYEDAGHTTEIEALDKIVVLGGQTTHVYMVGQKVPGCEVIPTVSSGYGLEDHTTYDPATGALGGYIDLTLTNPSTTSGTLTITDGTGSTTTRQIKSSDCPTDFETLARPATSITNNGATANWNSSADFEGVTAGTLYLYRDGVVDAEYITNEGFESGDLTGWNYLNVGALYSCDAYEVRNSNAHTGTHALYASDEGTIYSGFGYTTVIYGNPVTLPAGKYVMTSWVKVPKYSGYSDKHSYFKQGFAGCTLIGSTNETHYALSENYTDIQSNNTYVELRDTFVLATSIKTLPFVGHRADYGYTFHPFYLDDVSLQRISAPLAEDPDKTFEIADMSAASSQDLGTLSGNTQYTYLLKNANGCPSNSITFKTLPADGPTVTADDIEISAPAGSSATGIIVVQVWDATAVISVSKGVSSGSDQITLSNTTVPQEGGTIRVLFTPNTDPGTTGTCVLTLTTRGMDVPVTVNIHWTVTAGEDTDKPIVEVTDISNEYMKIEHNVTADSVRIVMNREKTPEEIEVNVGDEIFFSKYYEAYSHKKLWAIFNPTNDTISLAGMEVWRSTSKYDGWHSDVMDLSNMGYFKPGWICPSEEIVVYTTNQVGSCEQNAVGLDVMSTWWQEGTSSNQPLSFSGDDALLLVRNVDSAKVANNNVLPTTSVKGGAISWPEPYSNARGDWYMLDIIGGRTDGGNPSGKNVQSAWHWYNSKTGEYEDGDGKGWVGYGKDMSGKNDYNSSSEHPGYLLSTNRCLLVRAKSVTSGANAINSNIENMVTLNTEWQGSHVPTEGDQDAVSCSNFSFVGGYDYAGYYNAWTEMGDYEVGADKNPDGSYTVELAVPYFYCKLIHIEVMSIDTINGVLSENVHAYEDYKVPIVVDEDKLTTADLFAFGGDTCATCDVVIRDEAQLSHVSGGVDQFRNMIVYPGAKFDNSAKQGFLLDGLLMEAVNDEVGYAIINNNGSTIAAGKVVHVKRIDDQYWYPFSLPYDCDISAIRQLNGKSMGEYWEDWGIKYYDGAARQAEGSSAYPGTSSKYWKQMPVSGTLKANEAYIIGLFTTEWDGQFKSVYFPPKATKEYTEAGDDAKTTDVYNWAEGLANDKRHHGWNFVGSPYISMFGSSVEGHGMNNSTNLILGKINETSGEYEDLGSVYVSIPDGGNSKTYTQARASATTIEPFKGYFIQTVDPDNGIDNTLNLTYQKTDRTLTPAPARKATAQKLRVEADLQVSGNGMSDIAGVVVDDCYSPEYEIGGDLTKMYAAATKPQLYFVDKNNEKMAYIALPDAYAENIPMELYVPKAGQYTISLSEASSRIQGAESIELLYNGAVVANLLIEDYTLEAVKGTNSGYSVRIRRSAQVTTSTKTINGEHITVIANNGQMSITNLPGDAKVFVYDMTGRLMCTGNADGERVVNIVAPQQGVYNVVVQSAAGNAAIRTIVR